MTVASIARRPWVVGLGLWIGAILLVPAPMAARMWLAVPFVLVPLLAPSLASPTVPAGPLAASPWWSVVAGVPAAVALAAPTGSAIAGALVVPWLLLSLGELAAGLGGWRSWASADALGRIGTRGFLVIGAGSLLLDRLGIPLIGFSPTIVLLTAVHFSVAGFGLLSVAVLRAADGGRSARWAIPGLLVGIPMTGIGWVVGTPLAAWPGTLVVAGAGLLVAIDLGRSARGAGRAAGATRLASGIALAAGMLLAIGWSTALLLGVRYLDLEGMVRTHGSLNLFAVLVAAWGLGQVVWPELTAATRRRVRGATVALGITLPVAAWIAWSPPGTLTTVIAPPPLTAAALVGSAIAAWILADTPSTSSLDRAIRIGAMALTATLCAALVAAVLVSIDRSDISMVALGIPFTFVVGLGILGPPALVASLPAAMAWVWATDRWSRRVVG